MRLLDIFCCWLLLALASLELGAAEPKRVLFIHSFGRDFAPYNTFSGVLRTELASQLSGSVAMFEVSLDSTLVADTVQEGSLVTYLAALSAGRAPDLVIPIGGPAVQFAQRHRQALFPRTPLLIAGTDQRHIRQDTLTPNDAVVAGRIELSRVMQTILQLMPDTTNVAVVVGASPLDQFWLKEIRTEYQQFTNRVNFLWLNELSFPDMLNRCAALPPSSAIFYAVLIMDAEGVPHGEEGALTRLREVANAPVFGVFETQLGQGIVGGSLMDMEEMGQRTARVATRILRGEAPGSIQVPAQQMGAPQFDWRELRHWGISEAQLPAGSVVKFRQPGIWDRYWWLICGGVLFCAAQAALIIGLLFNRAKRRQGEFMATLIADLSSKFINLPPGAVDRQIEEAQRRVCESMGLDVSALWQWTDGPARFFKMTHLYRPLGGPPIPEKFDAQEVFPWCLKRMLAGEVIPVTSMDELPSEAGPDRESWRHFGIKSNLTFPLLVDGGRLIGGVSFNTMRKERSWPQEVVTPLQMVAQIFANALARTRAEQDLRESEARLTLAADAAAAGLWRLDLATNTFWVTKKTRELFAFSAEEAVTFDRVLSLIHPEDRELVRRTVEQVLKSRGEIEVEYRLLRPDGRVQWMNSRGRVLYDGSGEAHHLMGVTVDVTDRVKAQQVLREAEESARRTAERLSLAQRAGRVGVFDWDLTTNQVLWTPEQQEIFGLGQEEFKNQYQAWAKQVHPEDLPGLETMFAAWFASTRDEAEWDYRFVRHGEERWIAARGRLFRDKSTGRPLRMIGTNLDITERKRAERRARESEARLASAIQVAELGFYEMGSDPRQIFVDERLRLLLGLTPADDHRVQEFWIEHIHPDDRERVQEVSRKVVGGELQAATVDYRYQHPERGTLWFSHVSRAQEQDANGKVVRRLGVIRDITEQRRAELEGQRLRDNLAHLTRVNTLGALSGSLAHELNQPLGIILSNAQAAQELLAEEQPDTAEVQAILTDIVNADRRAGEVIDRLRALFKGGQVSLQRLSLNDVVEDVLRLTRAELLGRGVVVVRDLAPDLPWSEGDRVQLQQLLLNLILNASDAMVANTPGTRRLYLRTLPLAKHIRVTVRDEGEGLPSNVDRLFQPLYSTKPQGLGMGLAICRSIVAAHNGRLWAEPHPERGAIFYFELPMAGEGRRGPRDEPRGTKEGGLQ